MVSDAARRFAFTLPRGAEPSVDRISRLFVDHFDLVWRTVRRLGVSPGAIDDAAQEVFVIAARKLDAIEVGKEKSFLYGTAIRVAADARRAHARRSARETMEPDEVDAGANLDELIDQKRARELLDAIIARMPDDARDVFVLYELEGLTMAEIAAALELPAGTVASRLRRARELFAAAIARHEAKGVRHG
jgi:RNA polymerase sigma-70 factor (ECF subfamily)